jgi:hypothetical protein
MVIPRADLRLWYDHQIEIQTQPIGIVEAEIENEIDNAEGKDQNYWNAVDRMLEHYECWPWSCLRKREPTTDSRAGLH